MKAVLEKSSKIKEEKKEEMIFRTHKVQIVFRHREDEENKKVKQRWLDLCLEAQRLKNFLWRQWLVYTINNGNDKKIQNYDKELVAWHATQDQERKNNPKFKSNKTTQPPFPDKFAFLETKELKAKLSEKELKDEFPTLHIRCITYILQRFKRDLIKRQASQGNYKAWVAILLGRQAIPSFNKPQPVCFAADNLKLFSPDGSKNYHFKIRLWRLEAPESKKYCPSIQDHFELVTKPKNKHIFENLMNPASGWILRGSDLVFDKLHNKWFLHLGHDIPKVKIGKRKTKPAFLAAGVETPFNFRILTEGELDLPKFINESSKGVITFDSKKIQKLKDAVEKPKNKDFSEELLKLGIITEFSGYKDNKYYENLKEHFPKHADRITDTNPKAYHDGKIIGERRKALAFQTMSHYNSYAYAPTPSRKGHGRNRAMANSEKIKRAWKTWCNAINIQAAKKIIDDAEYKEVSCIYWFKPGHNRDNLFLAKTGKVNFTSSSWAFDQFESRLRNAAERRGIVIITVNSYSDV